MPGPEFRLLPDNIPDNITISKTQIGDFYNRILENVVE